MSDEPVDFNLLRVFMSVYSHRSITLASEALELSQPGVSGILKRLQSQLDVTLFTRDGRGISPTHHAHQLASQLEPALGQVHTALENVKSFSTSSHRKFIVYAPEPIILKLVPHLENDPELGSIEIEFRHIPHSAEQSFQDVAYQQLDMAIDFVQPSAASFYSDELFSDELCVIARQGHPRIKEKITTKQFYDERHITLRLRRENVYMGDYFTKDALKERKVAAECDSMVAQMALVATSDCLGLVTKTLAEQYAESLALQVLASPFISKPIIYRLVIHNRELHSQANKWLRGKFHQLIKQS